MAWQALGAPGQGAGYQQASAVRAVTVGEALALLSGQAATGVLVEQVVFDTAQRLERPVIFEQPFLEADGMSLGRLPQ